MLFRHRCLRLSPRPYLKYGTSGPNHLSVTEIELVGSGINMKAKATSVKKIEWIDSDHLHFDPKNPRFFRLRGDSSDEKIVSEMLDDEGVQDLMSSIGQQDYFPGEPLLITPDANGHHIVVEGNRRLAAVKLLNGQLLPPKRKLRSVAMLLEEANYKPTKLPCIIYANRELVLRYLGYRHITGIKEWDALSKARYLVDLKETFYSKLPRDEQLRTIAKEIGSRSDAVGKLLTGLALFEAAEESKFFRINNLSPEVVDFSYITTAIGYRNIAAWLGLEEGNTGSTDGVEMENLSKLFYWMYVPQNSGRTVVGETRKLKELAAVVRSEDGLRVLLDTGKLSDAYLYTDGPQEALSSALKTADAKLRLVWDTLLKSSPTEEHKDSADDLAKRAKKIYEQVCLSIDESE
jgi:hypothetical protein